MADDVKKKLSNGYDPDALSAHMEAIEGIQAQIDERMDEAKRACAPLRDELKEAKALAVDSLNCSRQALNAKIAERKDLRRAHGRRGKLDELHQDEYDLLSSALGPFKDTELGQAALEEAA